jgi:superfamily II DNA/RNA helicase
LDTDSDSDGGEKGKAPSASTPAPSAGGSGAKASTSSSGKTQPREKKKKAPAPRVHLAADAFQRPSTKLSEGSKEFISATLFRGHPNIPKLVVDSIEKSYGDSEGFDKLTYIQEHTIPLIAKGSNVLAQAKAGSGKTVAYAVGILSKIDFTVKKPQAIIVCKSRELCQQQVQVFKTLVACYPNGGEGVVRKVLPLTEYAKQNKGCDEAQRDRKPFTEQVIICTAGRMKSKMDKKYDKKGDLSNHVKILVLDEADALVGDKHTKEILKTLKKAAGKKNRKLQVACFSATYSPENLKEAFRTTGLKDGDEGVQLIKDTSNLVLKLVKQYTMYFEPRGEGGMDHLLELIRGFFDALGTKMQQVIIFVNEKAYGRKVADLLTGDHAVGQLYGGKKGMTNDERDTVMPKFMKGETQRLIATDVIGRGVDIPNVTHVINIDTPLKAMWNEKTRQNDLSLGHEEYLQRVGRAGRMGKTGVAITFMPGDHDQVKQYGPSKAKIDELKALYQCDIEEVPVKDEDGDIPEELWQEKFGVVE